jgi:hypothetical protein
MAVGIDPLKDVSPEMLDRAEALATHELDASTSTPELARLTSGVLFTELVTNMAISLGKLKINSSSSGGKRATAYVGGEAFVADLQTSLNMSTNALIPPGSVFILELHKNGTDDATLRVCFYCQTKFYLV